MLRANTPVLKEQLSEMYDKKQVEEGHIPTAGHSNWFSDHPEWLISAWVATGVQISDDHVVKKKMLTTLWTKKRADVWRLLQMYLPPTPENFVHAAVQHILQAMPCVGVTMDTRLFVSVLATEDELQQLWKAGEAATGGLAAVERAPSGGSAEAGAAAMEGLDYMELAPPVGSAVAKRSGGVGVWHSTESAAESGSALSPRFQVVGAPHGGAQR